jgi:hypothetical protein
MAVNTTANPVVTFWLDRTCSGLVHRPLCKIRECGCWDACTLCFSRHAGFISVLPLVPVMREGPLVRHAPVTVPLKRQAGVSISDAATPAVQQVASNGDTLTLYDVSLSWDQAQTFCVRRGGSLASFRDLPEMRRFSFGVSQYYSTHNPNGNTRQSVWTGLRNRLPGEHVCAA